VRVGAVGSGLELKLVNQLLVSIHVAAAAEASALITRLGLDPEASKRVLMSGWAASTMLDHCLPATFTTDRTPAGASLGGLFEVQRLIVGLAASCELSLPVFDTAHEAFAEQVDAGAGSFHLAQLARVYDEPRPAVDLPEATASASAALSGKRDFFNEHACH
jgi:3-hydroxyisobutyrate dehydrogenase-like beta-hydroxyacid dehydrogenase